MISKIKLMTALISIFSAFSAQAVLIDFDTVSSAPGITFTDTVGGGGCSVANYGHQSNGQACGIFSDGDASKLQIDIAGGANAISMNFGNDDPGYTNAGDLAILELWSLGSMIANVQVVLNRDDIMNQAISYAGLIFDQAFFYYGRALGDPTTGGGATNTGLTEIVDDIYIATVTTPEPLSILLIGLGLAGVGFSRRRAS